MMPQRFMTGAIKLDPKIAVAWANKAGILVIRAGASRWMRIMKHLCFTTLTHTECPDLNVYIPRGDNFVRIPNPHRLEIGINLISEILREGEISRDEWLSDR